MQPTSYDESVLKETVQRMVDAWNRHDGHDFAAPFADDADFIAFEGTHLRGRAEIEEFHRELFTAELRGTRLEGNVSFVRFLGPEIGIVHGWATTTLPGQTHAARSRDSMQFYIFRKRAGTWRCDAMLDARRVSIRQQTFADDFEAMTAASLRH